MFVLIDCCVLSSSLLVYYHFHLSLHPFQKQIRFRFLKSIYVLEHSWESIKKRFLFVGLNRWELDCDSIEEMILKNIFVNLNIYNWIGRRVAHEHWNLLTYLKFNLILLFYFPLFRFYFIILFIFWWSYLILNADLIQFVVLLGIEKAE